MSANLDITLPADQLEGTTAKVSEWLVECGAELSKGDPVLELETDKVTMEICAPSDGRLAEILKFPGDDVEPTAVLGRLTAIESKTIIDSDTPEKVAVEKVAAENLAAENLAAEKVASKEATLEKSALAQSTPETETSARHLVGPAVRRLLREHNLNIDLITGSGRRGRVTREDVLGFINNPPLQSASPAASPARHSAPHSAPHSATAPAAKLVGTMIPHTPMRNAIAKHMVESLLHTAPHVTSVFEMNMSNIIEHRRWHKKEFTEQGVKLTFTAYFLAACVKAMAAVPQMNARYHDDALELFEDINIGVGTALGDDGLVVPVVQQVQTKNLFDIALALQTQTDKARNKKLRPEDMKNGTFTISNHGVSGSLFAAPIIINQPQVAILGIGKLEKRVVVTETNGEDTISIKPMCYVSLSIDHRAVDAFQTNKFLSVFVDCIENWGE